MVRNIRRGPDGAFKAKVAQLSSEFGVHANQIGQWRKQVLKELPSLFSDRRRKQDRDQEDLVSELYRQIGQLFTNF